LSVHTLITKQVSKICFRLKKLHRERVIEGQLFFFLDGGKNFRLHVLPFGVIGHIKYTTYYPSRNCWVLPRGLTVYPALLHFFARQTTVTWSNLFK